MEISHSSPHSRRPQRSGAKARHLAEPAPRGEAGPTREHLPPGLERENAGLRRIADTAGGEPYAVLQGLLGAAVDLCGGAETSTAGISLLEPAPDGGVQFRWVALAGCLAAHVGGTTPRDFSPCGECLDRKRSIIIKRPDLKYKYFGAVGLEFTQGLVVPFSLSPAAEPIGTIWVVSHPPRRHRFDDDDVMVMESLGAFAGCAYNMAIERDSADDRRRRHDDVVDSISLGMRTPLTTVLGFIDLLTLGVHGGLNDVQSEYVARMRKSVQLLLAGVDGLTGSAVAASTAIDAV